LSFFGGDLTWNDP